MKRGQLSAVTIIIAAIIVLAGVVYLGFRLTDGEATQEAPEAPELPLEPTPTPTPEPPTEPLEPTVEEFTIEADDNSFSIDGQDVSSITVSSGNMVKINFLVSATQVYFGGLEFRGCEQDTGKVNPGDSEIVTFVAEESCQIRSYWPASNRLKDRLDVIVQ